MKIRKSFLLICLIICLLSMAGVCAGQTNDTLEAGGDIQLAGETDVEIQEATENENSDIDELAVIEDDSSDDPSGKLEAADTSEVLAKNKTVEGNTFADIANEIDSDCTVYLKPGCYTGSSKISIDFKSNIEIIGNSTVMDGQGETKIFEFTKCANITIRNITFVNVYAPYYEGGAISFLDSNNCSVSGCVFLNNQAYDGSAIHFKEGSNLNVSGCIFENNTANGMGSAVYWYADGKVNVHECNFINNHAREAGAVFIRGGSNGTVSGCIFENNTANNNGGAVYLVENSKVNVHGCNFEKNTAGHGGGAVYWSENGGGNVHDCSFVNNRANASDGGALYIFSSGNCRVSNCIFDNNRANYGGSAIYWSSSDNGFVSECVFVNNYVEECGTLNWYNSANGAVSHCIFVNNRAGFYGGAVYWASSGNGHISECVFINSSADRGTTIESNGIGGLNADYNWFGNNATNYNASAPVSRVVCNYWLFLNAEGPESMALGNSSDVTFDLFVYDSSANSAAGRFENSSMMPVNLTLTASNADVSSNVTKFREAVSCTPKSLGRGSVTAEFENALFAYEFDVKEDCGLSVEPADVPYGENIIISLNYNSSATGKVNITLKGKKGNYTFQNIDLNATVLLDQTVESDKYNITVTYSGDDMFFNASAEGKLDVFPVNTFSALNYLIRNNDEIILAGDYSFDSYWDSDFRDGILIDKPLSVIGNGHEIDAKGEARIFYVAAESINITDVTFRGGKADFGGAINFENDVRDSNIIASFIANEASERGGANFFAGKVENVAITGNFTSNSALEGGANLFLGDIVNVTLNGNFTNNTAFSTSYFSGGGANWFGPIINSTIVGNFINNTAYSGGGANLFFNKVTDSSITGNFTGNQARSTHEAGGANYFLGKLENVAVTGNFADNLDGCYGGANYFGDDLMNVTITGNFSNNTAVKGGANFFRMLLNNVRISGNFTRNSAYEGGANYFGGKLENVAVTGKFSDNLAQGYGGANVFTEKLVNVTVAGDFENNLANGTSYGGGANFFVESLSNVKITGNFTSNTAREGGANYFMYHLTNVTLTGNYINNTAQAGGANIFYGELTDSSITGNFITNHVKGAYNCGGANYFMNKVENVDITGNFTGNTAYEGGANYFSNPLINVDINGNYINNTAECGGAISFGGDLNNVTLTGIYISNMGESVIYIASSQSNNIIRDAIFINPNNTIAVDSGSIKSVDVWYGNNATNYSEKPFVGSKVIMTDWLFLNATADSHSLGVLQPADVIFELCSYDENTQKPAHYDNSKVSGVNLTVSSTNGNVSRDTCEMQKAFTYTPLDAGKGSVTASLANAAYTIEFDVRYDSNLTAVSSEVIYSESTCLDLLYNSSATGTVNITLEGKNCNYAFENKNLYAYILLGKIAPGEYNVTVSYSGDERFAPCNATATLKVLQFVDLAITKESNVTSGYVYPGDMIIFTVTVFNNGPCDATGVNVTEILDSHLELDRYYTWDSYYDSDKGIWYIGNLTSGDWRVLVIYAKVISVGIISNEVRVEACENDTNITNNYAKIPDITAMEFADLSADISLTGDVFNIGDIISWKITVSNAAGSGNASNVTLKEFLPAELAFISAVTQNGTYDADTGIWDIGFMANGTEAVLLIFTNATAAGDGFNNTVNVTCSEREINLDNNIAVKAITVEKDNSTVNVTDVTAVYGNAFNVTVTTEGALGITASLINETGGIITLDVDGNTVMIPLLDAGNYTLNVTTLVDSNHNPMSKTANVTVNKADSSLTVSDIAFDYGSSASLNVTFGGAEAVTASVNDAKGIVKVNGTVITVSALDAGSYTLTVTTVTDANHRAVTKKAKITVKKLKTKISAKSLTATYNKAKKLVITLKDAKGNPIKGVKLTVKLKNTKTLKTNKKGQIKVSTKKLAPKKYIAKITFKGTKNYVKSSKSVKVTVKKAKPKIKAKKKTFKGKKTKKYSVTLKNNRNKAIKKAKLTLKVKGKTYKAKTNSKGKATFRITKLSKKGTYKATVTYKGNKYYKKATKKVRLTVKSSAYQTVGKGSKDTATVKKVQQALKDNGYYLTYKGQYLKVDGKYDSCTVRSIKEFQKDHGLKVTGKADEKTAKKLKII